MPVPFAFFSFKAASAGARLIAWATDGPWSHCGLAFHFEDRPGEYYEALYSDGWHGPKPAAKLVDFRNKDPRNRLAFVPLPIEDDAAQQVWENANLMRIQDRGYPAWQLAFMLLCERYSIPVPHSATRVVCSEGLSRIVEPYLDLRDLRRRSHDAVNPNSAWRRLMEILNGYTDSAAYRAHIKELQHEPRPA